MAFTKDFGVVGESYPIEEEDGRLTMLKSASRVDWGDINNKLKSQAENYFINLEGVKTEAAERFEIKFFDLSITATKDILGPVINNGVIEWVAVVKKGQTVNPLDHIPSGFYTVYVDLSNKFQIQLIEDLLFKHKKNIRVIGINGNPKDASNRLGRMVYMGTKELLDKEKVRYTPTFSWPTQKNGEKLMGYAAFPYPYSADSVLEVLE